MQVSHRHLFLLGCIRISGLNFNASRPLVVGDFFVSLPGKRIDVFQQILKLHINK
jgi:hypothetical protein